MLARSYIGDFFKNVRPISGHLVEKAHVCSLRAEASQWMRPESEEEKQLLV
jgi:hypothetical protein